MVDKELKLKIKPVKKVNNDYQAQGALFYFEKNPQNNKNNNQKKKENKIDFNEVKQILDNKININNSNKDYKLVKAKKHNIINKNPILTNSFLNSLEINISNKIKISSFINNSNKK
jgi:hypothetical protein